MKVVNDFLKIESASSILLLVATVLALVVANTPLKPYYDYLLQMKLTLSVGYWNVSKPVLLCINEGLMAIFFFLIGLELKREFIIGHLRDRANVLLPAIGALGGLVVPALIFVGLNHNQAEALNGWAIPAATDIAFALGVLGLLGSRVPKAAKIFLMSLAIFDDLAAIIIIGIFYTDNISLWALGFACLAIAGLFKLRMLKATKVVTYLLVGFFLWLCVLKSGVHATLAGVITAFFIPIKPQSKLCPLQRLERDIHPWVAFIILPIFAFANAGLELTSELIDYGLHPVTIGVGLGLFVGKQLGVFTSCWLGIKLLRFNMPQGLNYKGLYGISVLTGIGFTMSLFIASLAFENTNNLEFVDSARMGILVGSLSSAALGYLVLRCANCMVSTPTRKKPSK